MNNLSRSRLVMSTIVSCVAFMATACGGEEEGLRATFTSKVVQLNTCRVVGERPETCVSDELTEELRVTLVEDDEKRVWLSGLDIAGQEASSVLGTRDSEDGFLFVRETRQVNVETDCTLEQSMTISLRVDEDAEEEDVGVDPCISLIGRETHTTTTSPECDDVNDPPVEQQRIVRRRWQKATKCGEE